MPREGTAKKTKRTASSPKHRATPPAEVVPPPAPAAESNGDSAAHAVKKKTLITKKEAPSSHTKKKPTNGSASHPASSLLASAIALPNTMDGNDAPAVESLDAEMYSSYHKPTPVCPMDGDFHSDLNGTITNELNNTRTEVPNVTGAQEKREKKNGTPKPEKEAKHKVKKESKKEKAKNEEDGKQEKTTTTAAAAAKQKLYSDVDSSCSENVTPRNMASAENTMSSMPVDSTVASPDDSTTVTVNKDILPPQQTNATRMAQEYRVGDLAPVIVKGHKYVFDNKHMRWVTHDVVVRILHPNRGVDQDDCFAIFAAELLDPVKAATPMFAKVYRRNISEVAEADYFSLGQAQALCEEFARDYTRQKLRPGYPRYNLPLLTNRVVVRLDMTSVLNPATYHARKGFFSYYTLDTRQMVFFMEPNTVACEAVGATFNSADVDDGKVYPRGDLAWPREVYRDIADGFSHFTFVQSRERMVVHGLLRSNGYLLDPLFHTTDRESFRMGDKGKEGIAQWKQRHRCGDTCRALGIRSFEDAVDVSAAAAFNPLLQQENHYTEYLHCVRQMRVVVRMALPGLDSMDESAADEDSATEAVSTTSASGVSPANSIARAASVAPLSFPVTVKATKYVFLPAHARWEKVSMNVRVLNPSTPDTSDDRTACFAIEEVRDGVPPAAMRAKFFLNPGVRDADYYHVGDAYCTCVALGQVFRGYRKNGVFERDLDFRSAYAVRVPQSEIPDSIKAHIRQTNFFAHTTEDSGDVMFVLEPLYTSDASTKPKDSNGFDDPELRQVVDAFSHFTLHKSGNHLLVCNFKCKDGLLTRPHINTSNGRGFETINDGDRGITHWVKHHTCNPLCKLLGMEPLPKMLKLYDISSSRLMKYINQVQQHALGEDEKVDFNLPSRPESEIISCRGYTAEPLPRPVEQPQKQPATLSTPMEQKIAAPPEKDAPTRSMATREDAGPQLRPWVHTSKNPSSYYIPKKNGVLASGPRRPLTQAELTRLQSRDIDTKYLLPATRYECNINDLTWTSRRIFVRVLAPERGIGQGGMRVCFEVADVDPEVGEEVVMVAKMYRRTIRDVTEKDYFTEVAVQKLSALFAKDFNAENKGSCDVTLNVLQGAVIVIERADLSPELLAKKTGFFSYRTSDTQRLMFSVEDRLVGRFTKYNGNMGEAYPTNESRLNPTAARERTKVFEAVESLSHYSLVKSEGGLLICDMQGVRNDLTDLEIHSYDGTGLGIGNFGARGMAKFAERHRCTDVCKALQLESLRDQKFEITEEVKKSNKFLRIFERSKEIDRMS